MALKFLRKKVVFMKLAWLPKPLEPQTCLGVKPSTGSQTI